MGKREIDYSLYLVTGRELLPPGKDYYESLEESLQGGVTLVQVREKKADTGEFIDVARKTKAICDKYNVPLLINDRVDVHLAIGSDGIHVGQSDMPLALARRLIGPDATIGISVGNVGEAQRAIADQADYVGIGAVWATGSKDVSGKTMLGPDGVGAILDVLAGKGIQSVAIGEWPSRFDTVSVSYPTKCPADLLFLPGGIHLPNLPQLLHGSLGPNSKNHLDGIAIISDIVSSTTPTAAARDLRNVVDSFKRARRTTPYPDKFFAEHTAGAADYWSRIGDLMNIVREETPLVHQITNNVVINDSANATLAVGASPIMATNPRDCKELSPAIGALLVNFGTIADKEGMMVAGREANVNKKPIVFDPVAIGATAFRRETAKELLAHWQPSVIKGNAGEIGAMAESTEVKSRGVDSAGPGFSNPAAVVRGLARKRACVVVLTGETDYVSDGEIVMKMSNGHQLVGASMQRATRRLTSVQLECITGSGCMLGTLTAVYCAAARIQRLRTAPFEDLSQLVQGDMFLAAMTGVLVMNIAAEKAAERKEVEGPATFRTALIDELYKIRPEDISARAKFEIASG
ncbi:thiamine-phosphate diphosphorylase / hydroxyethylthiazole kinase, partial [Tremellales sp. Uapishka_1]